MGLTAHKLMMAGQRIGEKMDYTAVMEEYFLETLFWELPTIEEETGAWADEIAEWLEGWNE